MFRTHVVEPYSSDIEAAMTPGTRRRLLEHTVYKAADLRESQKGAGHQEAETERGNAHVTDQEESETPSSRPSSKVFFKINICFKIFDKI